jgi:hypothetical protein
MKIVSLSCVLMTVSVLLLIWWVANSPVNTFASSASTSMLVNVAVASGAW